MLVVFDIVLELLDVVLEAVLDVMVVLEDVDDVAEIDELLEELIDWRVAFISTTV